nr:hypothetical protein [Tanacetum cinerariifolium]
GSGGGFGCVVVVPAVERQRSGVGGGVVLAAWVVVLAVGRRTLPEKMAARDGECHSRSDISGYEEQFWVRRKKPAEKVFRRRPCGGRWR